MKKKKRLFHPVFLSLLLSALLLTSCGESSYLETRKSLKGEEKEEKGKEDKAAQPKETGWYVEIDGAVTRPGVYPVKEGSRVFMLIKAAGGLRSDADTTGLNQAGLLKDGEKIHVLTKAEAEKKAEETLSKADGMVHLNSATKEDLMTLPGIGEAKADLILAYREEKGSFSSPEELMEISGIKEGAYNRLKDKVMVD